MLQASDDVANGPPTIQEEQKKLLQDARAKRDVFAQEKARVESMLNVTLEKVKLYQSMLGTTESKLCSVENLIGDIRFRLQQRGVPVRDMLATSPLQAPAETSCGVMDSANDRPLGTSCFLFTFLVLHLHLLPKVLFDRESLLHRLPATLHVYIRVIEVIFFLRSPPRFLSSPYPFLLLFNGFQEDR